MNPPEMIGLGLALVVMVVGLAGNLIPGIPGSPLILIGAVGHKLYFGEASVSYLVLVIMVLLTLLALGLEFLASMLGAKKLGATWRGMVGAVIGATIGLFFNIPGLIIGPFAGAFLFELASGREARDSAKAGAGALLGLVLGAFAKVGCSAAMIALFAFSVVLNSVKL